MPGKSSMDSHAYISPAMEHAVTQQLQSSLPAHLKQYVGQDKPAYIPEHIERQLAQQMQKMPEHLRQYSDAYLKQRLVKPGLAGLDPYHATQLQARAPVPDRLRLGHSMPVGEQHTVQWGAASPERLAGPTPQAAATEPFPAQTAAAPAAPQPLTPAPQPYGAGPSVPLPPNQPAPLPPAGPHQPEYEFIMNPAAPQPSKPSPLPGNNSMPSRILLVAGGVFALLIIGLILKSLLGGSSISPTLITVAQDQQEIIHLTTNANQQQSGQQQGSLSTSSQNFAVTAQGALTSSQAQLLTYLKNNGTKVGTKQLNLKVSASLDAQLSTAAASSSYDQTFQQISQAQLTTYEHDLQQAYAHTTGPKGRQLLSSCYDAAVLLGKQLSAPTS